MTTLIETTDRSLVESLLIGLDAEGIEAHVLDTGVASLPFVPIVVRVAEEDLEPAREVLQSLQRTPRSAERPPVLRGTTRVVLAILAVAAIACLCW